jgi:hypothetical protein
MACVTGAAAARAAVNVCHPLTPASAITTSEISVPNRKP